MTIKKQSQDITCIHVTRRYFTELTTFKNLYPRSSHTQLVFLTMYLVA